MRFLVTAVLCIALILMTLFITGCDNTTQHLLPTIGETWEEGWGNPPNLEKPIVRVYYQAPYNAVRSEADVREKLRTIDGLVKDAQRFYADEMERHNYGRKTFALQTRRTGELVIHRETMFTVDASGNTFIGDVNKEGHGYALWFIDVAEGTKTNCGFGGGENQIGEAYIFPRCWNIGTVTHELGHAFGLMHDWRDSNYIMSYGVTVRDGKSYKATDFKSELSAAAAGWLNQHTAFNEGPHDLRIETAVRDVQLISRTSNGDNTERLVFEFVGYHYAFNDYAPTTPLGWLLTYGILFDGEQDSVITGISNEAFSYHLVSRADVEKQVEYRLEFDADVRTDIDYGHLLLISQDGQAVFIDDGYFDYR